MISNIIWNTFGYWWGRIPNGVMLPLLTVAAGLLVAWWIVTTISALLDERHVHRLVWNEVYNSCIVENGPQPVIDPKAVRDYCWAKADLAKAVSQRSR